MAVINVDTIEFDRVSKLVRGDVDLLTAEAVNVVCLRPDDLTETAKEQLCQTSRDKVDLVAVETKHATLVHLRQLPFWKLLLGRGYRESFKASEHGHLIFCLFGSCVNSGWQRYHSGNRRQANGHPQSVFRAAVMRLVWRPSL